MTDDQRKSGVIAFSSGNFGQVRSGRRRRQQQSARTHTDTV